MGEAGGAGGVPHEAVPFDGTRYQITELLALRTSDASAAAAAPEDMVAAVAASVPRSVAECTGPAKKGKAKKGKGKTRQSLSSQPPSLSQQQAAGPFGNPDAFVTAPPLQSP